MLRHVRLVRAVAQHHRSLALSRASCVVLGARADRTRLLHSSSSSDCVSSPSIKLVAGGASRAAAVPSLVAGSWTLLPRPAYHALPLLGVRHYANGMRIRSTDWSRTAFDMGDKKRAVAADDDDEEELRDEADEEDGATTQRGFKGGAIDDDDDGDLPFDDEADFLEAGDDDTLLAKLTAADDGADDVVGALDDADDGDDAAATTTTDAAAADAAAAAAVADANEQEKQKLLSDLRHFVTYEMRLPRITVDDDEADEAGEPIDDSLPFSDEKLASELSPIDRVDYSATNRILEIATSRGLDADDREQLALGSDEADAEEDDVLAELEESEDEHDDEDFTDKRRRGGNAENDDTDLDDDDNNNDNGDGSRFDDEGEVTEERIRKALAEDQSDLLDLDEKILNSSQGREHMVEAIKRLDSAISGGASSFDASELMGHESFSKFKGADGEDTAVDYDALSPEDQLLYDDFQDAVAIDRALRRDLSAQSKSEVEYYGNSDIRSDLHFRYILRFGRHTKVTAAGRVRSASVLILVGNQNGTLGIGYGKAEGVSVAVYKALINSLRNLVTIDRVNNVTISDEISVKYKSAKIWMRPARPGHGLRCSPMMQQICHAAGIRDLTAKIHGRRNPLNMYVQARMRLARTR